MEPTRRLRGVNSVNGGRRLFEMLMDVRMVLLSVDGCCVSSNDVWQTQTRRRYALVIRPLIFLHFADPEGTESPRGSLIVSSGWLKIFFNEYCNRWVRELVKNFHHIKYWRRAICFSAEPECFSWRWQLRSAAKSIRLVIFRNWVGHKKKMENWNVVPCLKQAKRAESTSGFGGVSDRPAIYFIQKKLKFGSPLFNGFDSIRRKMWCNVMEQLHSMAALWRIGRKCTRSWSIRGEFPSSILVLRRKWETFRTRSFMEVVKLEYFF